MPRHTKEFQDRSRMEKTNERFTVKGMLSDEFYNFVHMERRKLFYTAWDLTVRPAASIKMVLAGYRKYLYPYLNYLVLIGAITIFLSVRYKFFVSGIDIGDKSAWAGNLLDWMGFNKKFRQAFFNYAEEYTTIVNIVALPFFSLSSYLFFRRTGYNYAEHFILNVYIAAQQLLLLLLFIPFFEIYRTDRDTVITVYTVLIQIYNVWVYTTIFAGKTWIKIIKSILAIALAFFVQTPFNYGVFALLRPFTAWLDKIF
jgi:hypothetical protein